LRDFTALSDRLTSPDVLKLLNAYFEAMTEAVLSKGAEVLKFVGDGLLAVFPVESDDQLRPVAKRALLAAWEALASLEETNRRQLLHLLDRGIWHRPKRRGENISIRLALSSNPIGIAIRKSCERRR
jgi:class 3 adenylate cyclase